MARDIVQEIETLLGRQAVENLDFEALEMARQRILQLAARAIEQRLNADTSDEAGSRQPCRCGREAKTREVKLCTVWSAESCDDQGIPIRDEGSVSYSAAIESASAPDTAKEPSAFAQRVWRESQRRRFTQAVRRVALGDGAPWIWNLIEELFPGITQIVDRFHAKEHLSDLGKALYGDQRASRWASEGHEELDKGKLRAIVAAIRPHWVRSRKHFFLPKKVLRKIFRGKFVHALKQAFQDGRLRFDGNLKLLAQPRIFAAWLRPL